MGLNIQPSGAGYAPIQPLVSDTEATAVSEIAIVEWCDGQRGNPFGRWVLGGLAGLAVASSASPATCVSRVVPSSAVVTAAAGCRVTVAPQAREPLTLREHALAVCTVLGLSKSEVARILGVSRPALYAWINGESEPQGANAERLRGLGRLAAGVCRDTHRPLFHGYVSEALPGEPSSLLDLLLAGAWDEPRLGRLFAEARRLTTARDARIARSKPSSMPSEAVQEDILSDNLKALGAEG